jgi:putative membrane protein
VAWVVEEAEVSGQVVSAEEAEVSETAAVIPGVLMAEVETLEAAALQETGNMTHSRAVKFFTESEKKRIKEATSLAESATIGEIAVMVVDKSSEYHEAEIIGGITIGNFAALFITTFFFHDSIWWYIPFTFILFFPAWFLFKKFHVLKIHCIGNKRKEKAVKERALKAFYEKGLYKTKQNTGVLFFISLLEHKVWVLADVGIHEKVKQVILSKITRQVAQGIKEGRACDALVDALGETGRLLAEHFPARPGDVDELPDEVLFEGKSE